MKSTFVAGLVSLVLVTGAHAASILDVQSGTRTETIAPTGFATGMARKLDRAEKAVAKIKACQADIVTCQNEQRAKLLKAQQRIVDKLASF